MSANANQDHVTRPEPKVTGPNRTGWSHGPKPKPEPEPVQTSPEVSQLVADAVRIGYDVIGLNLAHGRAAADSFRAGTYGVDDIPHDISRLGKRLLQLTRDLGTTGFDLMAAVLNDPAIRQAIQPNGPPNPNDPQRRRQPGAATVNCVFRGRGKATAEATTLQQPDSPTTLTIAGLMPVAGKAPPITRISFGPAHLGRGIIATITIPDDQPAGTYVGDIKDEATNNSLGTLTIAVLAEVPEPAKP